MCNQVADSIIVKGEKYCLYTFPLDRYWTRWKPKPPIQMPKTSCWRGYVATWKIFENSLYLIDIIFNTPTEEVGLDYLFPHNTGQVKADWYTSELQIPLGDRLYCENMEDPVYEYDLFLKIKKGNVKSHRYKANY